MNEESWLKIHKFILRSGSARSPREMCVEILRGIGSLVPHDRASIYFINDNSAVCDEVLFNVDREWSKAYLDYYSNLDEGIWNVTKRINRRPFKRQVDWTVPQDSPEFFSDYVRPQKIRYSIGFGLHDQYNQKKCVFCLDRTSGDGFTEQEMDILSIVQPHLDNLHKNLHTVNASNNNFHTHIDMDEPLTCRESEIAALLREGVTPAGISQKFSLSLATVYKHISNIHAKLHVSNRQELLLKLLEAECSQSGAH
jgi:DNA-binding CsgD family transcriptional regulator